MGLSALGESCQAVEHAARGWRFVGRRRDRRLAGKTFELTGATLCEDVQYIPSTTVAFF
jgi:hypothetical protein